MDSLMGPELRRQLRTAWILRAGFALLAGINLCVGLVAIMLGASVWAICYMLAGIGCAVGWVAYSDQLDDLRNMEWDLRLVETPDEDEP